MLTFCTWCPHSVPDHALFNESTEPCLDCDLGPRWTNDASALMQHVCTYLCGQNRNRIKRTGDREVQCVLNDSTLSKNGQPLTSALCASHIHDFHRYLCCSLCHTRCASRARNSRGWLASPPPSVVPSLQNCSPQAQALAWHGKRCLPIPPLARRVHLSSTTSLEGSKTSCSALFLVVSAAGSCVSPQQTTFVQRFRVSSHRLQLAKMKDEVSPTGNVVVALFDTSALNLAPKPVASWIGTAWPAVAGAISSCVASFDSVRFEPVSMGQARKPPTQRTTLFVHSVLSCLLWPV